MWRTVKLGDVVSYEKVNGQGSNRPYVGMEHISSETMELVGSLEIPEKTSSTFKFDERHVLFGRLRPYLRKVFVPDFDGQCSTEIFCLLPSEKVDKKFLAHWLLHPKVSTRINETSTGARMPRANMNAILDFNFPLPPLAEQQRIVAKLDAAFAEINRAIELEREKVRQAECLLKNSIREKSLAVMQQYGSKPLDELCDLQNGFAFKSTKFRDDGMPVLRISNIQEGTITTDKLVYASQDDYSENLKRYIVKKEALLLAMSGATTGKVGINRSEQNFYLNQRVGMLTPKSTLDRDFLYFFLTTKVEELLSISAGAAQPNLSAKQIKEIQLPNALLAQQRDFSSALNKLNTEIDSLLSIYKITLGNLDVLKAAILAQELQSVAA